MEQVDLGRFYSGGYFITRPGNPGWEQLKDLLPDKLISLSNDICQTLELNWGWPTGDIQSAINFGIDQNQIAEFSNWCYEDYEGEMSMWRMFHSPAAARHFVTRFIPNTQDLRIIGAGLPAELEIAHWRVSLQDGKTPYGIEQRIERRLPMEPGGQSLGFEVLSFGYGDFGHSWLCNYLHQDMYQLYSIQPSEYGLIQHEQEAQTVYEWILEDEMRGHRAEPEPYDYWLLVDYPLNEG